MKERTKLEGAIATIKRLRAAIDDNVGLIEMAEAEKDEAMIADAERALGEARAEAAKARLETLLVGRGRRQQRLCRAQCRRRRHRGAGLGRDAGAHVHALGRAPRLQGELAGGERGRRGRHQVVRLQGRGPQRLWLAEDRIGRAPPGAHLAVRRQCAAPDLVRLGLGLSRGRRRHRDRACGQGPARRHLPRLGRGRPARQQDRLGGAHHPHPDRHRRRRAAGALASTRTAPRPCRC